MLCRKVLGRGFDSRRLHTSLRNFDRSEVCRAEALWRRWAVIVIGHFEATSRHAREAKAVAPKLLAKADNELLSTFSKLRLGRPWIKHPQCAGKRSLLRHSRLGEGGHILVLLCLHPAIRDRSGKILYR